MIDESIGAACGCNYWTGRHAIGDNESWLQTVGRSIVDLYRVKKNSKVLATIPGNNGGPPNNSTNLPIQAQAVASSTPMLLIAAGIAAFSFLK